MKAQLNSARSTQEVFEDHLRKREEGRFEEDLKENYAESVVLLTCTGIYRGHAGLRESHKVLEDSLPDAKVEYHNRLVDGECAFLEWRAVSGDVEVREGADSFLIRDGKIQRQTIHYKVHPCDRESLARPGSRARSLRFSTLRR